MSTHKMEELEKVVEEVFEMVPHPALQAEALAVAARVLERTDRLERELAEARDTIRRLNRRCQEAESGVAERIKQDPHGTNSKGFGRRLIGAAASQYKAERDEARAERDAKDRMIAVLRSTLEAACPASPVLADTAAAAAAHDREIRERAWREGQERMRERCAAIIFGQNTTHSTTYRELRGTKREAAYAVAHELEHHHVAEIRALSPEPPPEGK